MVSPLRQELSYFQWGVLNDVTPWSHHPHILDPKTMNPVEMSAKMAMASFSPTYVPASSGAWNAVVLRVEGYKARGNFRGTKTGYEALSAGKTADINLVVVKAMIPEVHMNWIKPERYGDEGDGEHQTWISLFPSFVARNADLSSPACGSVIRVSFGNIKNGSDPAYEDIVMEARYVGPRATLRNAKYVMEIQKYGLAQAGDPAGAPVVKKKETLEKCAEASRVYTGHDLTGKMPASSESVQEHSYAKCKAHEEVCADVPEKRIDENNKGKYDPQTGQHCLARYQSAQGWALGDPDGAERGGPVDKLSEPGPAPAPAPAPGAGYWEVEFDKVVRANNWGGGGADVEDTRREHRGAVAENQPIPTLLPQKGVFPRKNMRCRCRLVPIEDQVPPALLSAWEPDWQPRIHSGLDFKEAQRNNPGLGPADFADEGDIHGIVLHDTATTWQTHYRFGTAAEAFPEWEKVTRNPSLYATGLHRTWVGLASRHLATGFIVTGPTYKEHPGEVQVHQTLPLWAYGGHAAGSRGTVGIDHEFNPAYKWKNGSWGKKGIRVPDSLWRKTKGDTMMPSFGQMKAHDQLVAGIIERCEILKKLREFVHEQFAAGKDPLQPVAGSILFIDALFPYSFILMAPAPGKSAVPRFASSAKHNGQRLNKGWKWRLKRQKAVYEGLGIQDLVPNYQKKDWSSMGITAHSRTHTHTDGIQVEYYLIAKQIGFYNDVEAYWATFGATRTKDPLIPVKENKHALVEAGKQAFAELIGGSPPEAIPKLVKWVPKDIRSEARIVPPIGAVIEYFKLPDQSAAPTFPVVPPGLETTSQWFETFDWLADANLGASALFDCDSTQADCDNAGWQLLTMTYSEDYVLTDTFKERYSFQLQQHNLNQPRPQVDMALSLAIKPESPRFAKVKMLALDLGNAAVYCCGEDHQLHVQKLLASLEAELAGYVTQDIFMEKMKVFLVKYNKIVKPLLDR